MSRILFKNIVSLQSSIEKRSTRAALRTEVFNDSKGQQRIPECVVRYLSRRCVYCDAGKRVLSDKVQRDSHTASRYFSQVGQQSLRGYEIQKLQLEAGNPIRPPGRYSGLNCLHCRRPGRYLGQVTDEAQPRETPYQLEHLRIDSQGLPLADCIDG